MSCDILLPNLLKKMTNKIVNILIISVGIVFLCWYLPVAFYNVFACDDYWFGTNVRINGFWNNQLFYWHNWEGSYTHTFLASLPHLVQYSRMPFIGNMFSLLLFCFNICFSNCFYYSKFAGIGGSRNSGSRYSGSISCLNGVEMQNVVSYN